MENTDAKLRQFVERYERLDEERRELAKDLADVIGEAKAMGYDKKAFKEVIRIRRMKPDDRREFETVVGLYKNALGIE